MNYVTLYNQITKGKYWNSEEKYNIIYSLIKIMYNLPYLGILLKIILLSFSL